MVVALGLLAAGGCTRPAPPPLPPLPPIPATPDTPGLHALLTWDAAVDLDLYVTDPTFETTYFANTPSRSGGEMRRDVRCADGPITGVSVEQVTIPSPRPGPYRIGVDFIDACGAALPAATFRVLVALRDGDVVTRDATDGRVELGVFRPDVLDVVVTATGGVRRLAPQKGPPQP